MDPEPAPLRMFGTPSEQQLVGWSWVRGQLVEAGTYWVTARGSAHPHPRPVWGVWLNDDVLWLSVGSPVVAAQLEEDARVTVHLDSGTEVVIVEGEALRTTEADSIDEFLAAYDRKYDWHYTVAEFGPPTVVQPERVLAWRSTGFAGRDGFQQASKWVFPS